MIFANQKQINSYAWHLFVKKKVAEVALFVHSFPVPSTIDITVRDGKLKFPLNQNVLRDVTSRWSMRIIARRAILSLGYSSAFIVLLKIACFILL